MIFKIKLATIETNSKLLMLLHNKTNRSLSDIKVACANGESIYECDSADTQGLITLNNLSKEITDLGFETNMYIDDEQVDAEVFANIEKRNIEINNEFDC